MQTESGITPWFHDRRWQWLACVLVALALTSVAPSPADWTAQLRAMGLWFWPVFLLLQWGCALLLVPSLPLVVLAATVFPEQPLWVWAMALFGVAGSSALIYHFCDALGLTRMFAADRRADRARLLISRHGATALALWAATPFLPTDLGCYLAASAKMGFKRYLFASLLGESLLCASVIWGASHLARHGI